MAGDKWEGAFSQVNIDLRKQMKSIDEPPYGHPWSPWQREMYKKLMYISCWHESEGESAAMWDIYQREGRGVAIRTTWAALSESLTGDRYVVGTRVKYVDYDKVAIEEYSGYYAFAYKRESFRHENEARLMVQGGTGVSLTQPDDPHRSVQQDEGPVIKVSVDLDKLIQKVYVAPTQPGWYRELIESICRRYGRSYEVLRSDLDSDPVM